MQLTHSQILQVTHEQVTLVACDNKHWEHFKMFHYMGTICEPAAKCHLAVLEINGAKRVIGFCAAMNQVGRNGKADEQGRYKNAWKAHKTVLGWLAKSPADFHLWAIVSDLQAQYYVKQGVRFYSRAPIEYASYRDNPATNWVRTCKDAEAIKKHGERSHQYKWIVSTNDTEVQKKGYRSHQFVRVLTAGDVAEAISTGTVIQVPKDTYSNHPLPSQHFRGKNPGGYGKVYAYAFGLGRTVLGFALMKQFKTSATLTRVIVEPTLPRDANIFVGRALVQAMCREYSVWHSVTDADNEANFYHEYYKVDGVLKSEPVPRKIPAEFAGIPISKEDWQSRESCDAFVKLNPEWAEKITTNAQMLAHLVRPGGKKPSLEALKNKVFHDGVTAGRILHSYCPAMQITYSFDASKLTGPKVRSPRLPAALVTECDADDESTAPEGMESFEDSTDGFLAVHHLKYEGKNLKDVRHITMALYRVRFMMAKARLLAGRLGTADDAAARKQLRNHFAGCEELSALVHGLAVWIYDRVEEKKSCEK